MDRLKATFRGSRPSPSTYEPLEASISSASGLIGPGKKRFSWIEYGIFVFLGVAMLWAWNMYLAAAPYFHSRFESNNWLVTHFQSSITTVSTVTNLCAMIILTKFQKGASFPRRIAIALVINTAIFILLSISTTSFGKVTPEGYFAFLLITVFFSAIAASFLQNGLFAFVSGFGQPDYTQGIMAGQGIAGVLPPIVQIVSVLGVPADKQDQQEEGESYKSAFAYFLTATSISVVALLSFWVLARRNPENGVAKKVAQSVEEAEELEQHERKDVSLLDLFFKLKWFGLGVFVTFAVTMVFPVYTSAIVSVRDPATAPRLFQPECFIPLGFLVWNAGDLIGRVLPSFRYFNATHAPKQVFIGSVVRLLWIPLYELCNIHGNGAIINSDVYYLLAVQLLFGMSNGYLGSTCMMSAPAWVDDEEKEAAGGFMGLMLVAGLTVGSVLSFSVARE